MPKAYVIGQNTISNMSGYKEYAAQVPKTIKQHGGKFLSAASFYHTIDLQKYQPFVGFQIEVTRITNSEDLTDNQAGRAHVWDLGRSDGRPRLGWRGIDGASHFKILGSMIQI